MSAIRQRGTGDGDKSAETEIEGNIRELVRRDATVLRQVGDNEVAADSLNLLLRRVSGTSAREIDNLINELKTLREKLQADGDRVERDIVEYATLNQSVIQLTRIIAEGVTQVKKVPDAPSISE